MKLEKLREEIRAVAVIDETAAPVLSCYVDLEAGQRSYRLILDERIRTLRGCLALSDVKDFETALGQIEAFLGTSAPSTKGSAIFARAGGHPFFRALEFRVPVRTALSVDTVPQVYQLVELKDTYHRYVVLIATEERARILEVDVGEVTRELWASRPELRQRVGRGWTREHYQNHRRDRGEKFVKEKIAILDRLMSAEGHSHLILAGSPKITEKISKNLPKRLADKLVDVISASTKDKTSDIVVATLSSFTEHEQRESLRTALLLKEELQRGGLAVAGTGPTLEALRSGQADMLVMASAYKAPPGWTCRPCGATGAARQVPAACPECGASEVGAADLKEEMARLAEQHSVEVEILRDSDALLELTGVGCLLRYLTPEQRMETRGFVHHSETKARAS